MLQSKIYQRNKDRNEMKEYGGEMKVFTATIYILYKEKDEIGPWLLKFEKGSDN